MKSKIANTQEFNDAMYNILENPIFKQIIETKSFGIKNKIFYSDSIINIKEDYEMLYKLIEEKPALFCKYKTWFP